MQQMKEMKISERLPTLGDCDRTAYAYNKFGIPRKSYDGQENYVLDITDGKKNGFYVDIGASHYEGGNNTFILEKQFGWDGILIEMNKSFYEDMRKFRSGTFCGCQLVESSKVSDNNMTYRTIGEIFEEHKNKIPQFIDYLSLDIDDADMHYAVLQQLDYQKYTIGIIVVEHALYVDMAFEKAGMRQPNNLSRKNINKLLTAKGYIYDGNISVNDAYLHESICETYRKRKNPEYDFSLRFDL